MTAQPGTLVTFRNDRLGGRVTALANTMRVARALDAPFGLHWHAADDHGRTFNDPADFFDTPFLDRHLIDRDAFRRLQPRLTRLEPAADPATLRARLAAGDSLLIDRSLGLTLLPGEDEGGVRAALAALWRDFPFAPALRPRMAAIRAQIGPQATACHIRRGDILSVPRTMNKPWPNKFIIDEIFEAHIARATAAGDRPILFSDDTATLRRFEARFPTLIAADRIVDAIGLGEGQRDLLELYAMSLCRRIVAPPQSAFSGTAATLGGGELIDVTADLPADDLARAWDTLTRRLETAMPQAVAASPAGVAQSLLHLESRLRADKALPRARDLFGAAIASGAAISFLYPRHAALALETLPAPDARSIATAHAQAAPYHPADLAMLRAQAATAALAMGDNDHATQDALAALAEAPAHRLVREVAGALYAIGILNTATAPILTPAAAGLQTLRPRLLTEGAAYAALVNRLPQNHLIPRLDALLWDWDQILRPAPAGAVARAADRPGWDRAFDRALRRPSDDPDLLSLKALYDALSDPAGDGAARLDALAAAHPRDAMVLHRRSVAAFHARNTRGFATMAEAAADAHPAPAHIAWRAFARARTKQTAAALKDADSALAQGLRLPIIHLIAARSAIALKANDAAMRHLDAAIALSPRNPTLLVARFHQRIASGDRAAAAADLAVIETLATPPMTLPALRDALVP
jgi:tetratricopeptide (TPR) repeat protein